MANMGRAPISLLSVLLLIGPGLIGLELYFKYSEKSTSLSRLHLIVYSAVVSITSILFLYLLSPFYFPVLSEFSNSTATNLGIISESTLLELTIPDFVSLYLLHFSLAAILGLLFGDITNRRSEKDLDRREAWQYAFEVVPEDGEKIEVIMDDGTTIQGQFNEKAWDDEQRELFLEDPRKIKYKGYSNEIDQDHTLGRSVLLQKEAISQIIFTDDDPQSEIDPEDSETDSGSKEVKERVAGEVDSLVTKAALSGTSPQDDMDLTERLQSIARETEEKNPES